MWVTSRVETAPTIPHMNFSPVVSLLFFRPFPASHCDLFGACHGQGILVRVLGNGRSRANGCASADFHRRHQRTVGTDEGTVADNGFVLVDAIVVAGDGASTHVDLVASDGVTQIGQVVGLAALAQHGIFRFHEVTDPGVFFHFGARTQAGERAYIAVGADHGIFDVAVGLHNGIIGNAAVDNHAVGADLHIVAQRHVAFKDAVDVDAAILAYADTAANVDTGRIDQRSARHHQLVRQLLLVHALQPGQLPLVVDAFHFHRVIHQTTDHRHVVIIGQLHYIGQVVLALRIVVRDLGQPGLQIQRVRQHDAGVHFADLADFVAGILFLDDLPYHAGMITDDAAVALGIGQLHGQHAALARRNLIQETVQRVIAGERHVAVQHQGAGVVLQL